MILFKPDITDRSVIESIAPVLQSGQLGFGPNVAKLEEAYATYSNKKYNVGVNSASAAAFMIFAYLKEKYGACDVYTPSIGFTSPAWAAKHFGHNIIWVEVDENLVFDITDYKAKRLMRCERYSDAGIKPVLMPILYGGISNIPSFEGLESDGYREIIVVDSAHCATPTMKSDFTFFSFHPYKPIAASDGGMISTDIEEASKWFHSYRNFGRETVGDTYDIVASGFKFYINNLNATIALTQMDIYEDKLSQRREAFEKLKQQNYDGRLLEHDEKSSYYFATLVCNTQEEYERLNAKFQTSKHYPMMHLTKYYADGTKLPFTEDIHSKIVNLPLYDVNIYNS